jgi:hypothetical protein
MKPGVVRSELIHGDGQLLPSAALAGVPGSAVRLDECGDAVETSESFRWELCR